MRRAAFYLFFDPQGLVDDYIVYKLERLRAHVEHLFVVSNSLLDDVQRAKLEAVADVVWVRENVGLDVWAYKEAMMVFGEDRLAGYDELLLLNYTFFGPVGSFEPLFAEMDERDVDFWGITEHDEVVPHPFSPDLEIMQRHIQSHWIGVRASMFTSQAWRDYWSEMPMITSYFDSINRHEARFTHHFDVAGFRHHVVFSVEHYASRHPIMDDTVAVLRDGCPIVKRRSFFADPLYAERQAISGREILDSVAAAGYPVGLMLSNLARTSEPRVLATNLSLLEVLPLHDTGGPLSRRPRIAAIAHVFYPEMAEEILDRFACLPDGYDLYLTTADEERRQAIQKTLASRGDEGEVRVVESNRGRDISAFLVSCRDVIDPERYDLVVKLHSKRSPQDGAGVAEHFKRHLFDNLLASPGYVANVLRLFDELPSLGMVFPPAVHIGYPTLGHAWFGNKGRASEEADRLGITVPFDATTPLAAYGSMFIARPQALRLLLEGGYEFDDFPDESGYSDGALSHVLERLLGYAVLSDGYHVREVSTPASLALNYSFLEFKHQSIAAHLPGYTVEQIRYVQQLKSHSEQFKRSRRRADGRGRSGGARNLVRRDVAPVASPSTIESVRDRLGSVYRSMSDRRGRP